MLNVAKEKEKGRQIRNKVCEWGKFVIIGVVLLFIVMVFHELFGSRSGKSESLVQSISDPIVSKTEETNTKVRKSLNMNALENIQKVDCEKLRLWKKRVQEAKSEIWNTWDVSKYPNFLKIMHIPLSSWNIQKAKFISMLLEGMQGRYEGEFVVGFSGSSVTAGHDNYFTEAYPQIFHDRLNPVFQAFNIPLIVRNHAIGNNPCYPYDTCIATHLGDDLDILTWEQSMNCGRDWKPLDTFTRSAAYMSKQPTVMYFLSGGPSWTEKDCAAKNLTAGHETEITTGRGPLTTEEARLLHTPYVDIVSKTVNTLETMEFLKERGTSELSSTIFGRYARFAPMGHSTYSIGEYQCYGPYNYTYGIKTPGGGAPWHPGRVGHQLRGDSMAYAMLSLLSDSLDVIMSLTSLDGTLVNACKVPATATATKNIDTKTTSLPPPVVIGEPVIEPGPEVKHVTPTTSSTRLTSSSRALLLSKEDIVNELLSYHLPPSTVLSYLPSSTAISTSTLTSTQQTISLEERTLYHKLADRIHSILHSLTKGQDDTDTDVKNTRAKILYLYSELLLEIISTNPLPAVPSTSPYPETNNPPQCYTDFLPKMSANNLYDILLHHPKIMSTRRKRSRRYLKVAKDVEEETYSLPELVNRTTNFTITTPFTLEEIDWKKELSFFDVNGVTKGEQRHFGYLDRKYIYLSNGPGTALYLLVSVQTANTPIWLCECQKGFGKYPSTMTDLHPGALVIMHYFPRLTTSLTSSSSASSEQHEAASSNKHHHASFVVQQSKSTELDLIADQCYRTKEVFPKGDHILQIVQRNNTLINLAYVVTW